MTMIKARFDGRVFVPEQAVDLPTGYELEIAIPARPSTNGQDRPLIGLSDELEALPPNSAWPADGAAQHDHYLYGAPKKS